MKFKELREKYKGKYPPEMVAAAVKIALDMAGAMTPATKKIEAMRRGLSNDPIVKDALRQANEQREVEEEKFKLVDMDNKTAMNAQKLAKKAGLKAVVKKTRTGTDVMVVGDNKKMAKFLMSLPKESVQEANFMLTVPKGGPGGKDLNMKVSGKDKNDAVKQWRKKNRKYKDDEVIIKPLKEETLEEFKTSMPFFDLKKAAKAEKLAQNMGILKDSEKKGKLYTVHVDGKFTDIEKWLKLI